MLFTLFVMVLFQFLSTIDEAAGEVPVAFVVKRPGSTLSKADVINYVSRQVIPFQLNVYLYDSLHQIECIWFQLCESNPFQEITTYVCVIWTCVLWFCRLHLTRR